MKTPQKLIIAFALLVAFALSTFAVVDQRLEVSQGTNLVLSWPSQGYEEYLIQYRSDLNDGTPWVSLTNNYAANSTNRTAYTLYGLIPPPSTGTNGGIIAEGPPEPGSNSFSSSQATWPSFPPVPWDTNTWITPSFNTSGTYSLESFEESEFDGPAMGFYRVFHIPDWFVNMGTLTNHIFDGPTFIPVDYKDYVDNVSKTDVLINGQPSDNALFYTFSDTNGVHNGIVLLADRLTNGTYQIQLLSTISLAGDIADNVSYLTLSNKPVQITVSNLVTFTDWNYLAIGTNHTFKAKSSVPVADWEIDIYDASGNFVNYQTGSTTNGLIQWTWDLKDMGGNLRADASTDPVFVPYVFLTFETSFTSTVRRAPPVAPDYPGLGLWTITYQDRDKRANAREDLINAMDAMSGGPGWHNIGTYNFALEYGTNAADAEGYPATDPWTAQTNRNVSWDTFRNVLLDPSVRNLYYNGHGSPYEIGGDVDTYTNYPSPGTVSGTMRDNTNGGTRAFITSGWVRANVTGSKFGRPQHPYRFVFLDGCNTAMTNAATVSDWPSAFMIGYTTNTLGFYTNANHQPHTRPSAYVGWSTTVGGTPEWGNTKTYGFFRTQWMFLWSFEADDLISSFRDANASSHWISDSLLWSSLKVYGYQELLFNEYNQRGDWP